tara:strand:- start:2646 stop:2915 length:270 start_codon:yes stop_codon:yes gene_type:complete
MVLGLAAGIGLPLLLKATGADKEIIKGIRSLKKPHVVKQLKRSAKDIGFKHGGIVPKNMSVKVHKGEYVLNKKQVDKIMKAAKKSKSKK